MNQAEVKLINSTSSLKGLHEALGKLSLLDEERLRPSWDQYFMQLSSLAAHRSNCMKRRVGCVLVRERRVISTGYNGTPRNLQNCNEGGCEPASNPLPWTNANSLPKVPDAIKGRDLAMASRLVFVCMLKRTLCSKPAGRGSEKDQRCIATREFRLTDQDFG